jgi:hypothetical protein
MLEERRDPELTANRVIYWPIIATRYGVVNPAPAAPPQAAVQR